MFFSWGRFINAWNLHVLRFRSFLFESKMFDFTQLNRLRSQLSHAIVTNDLDLFSQLVGSSNESKDTPGRLHNLNYLDTDGQTPLHRTCHRGQLAFVKLLVENGANQHIQNKDGWYPVHLAGYYGHCDIVKYLLSEENFVDHPKIDVYEKTRPVTTRPTPRRHFVLASSGSESDDSGDESEDDDFRPDRSPSTCDREGLDQEDCDECGTSPNDDSLSQDLDLNNSLFKDLLDWDLRALEELSLSELD